MVVTFRKISLACTLFALSGGVVAAEGDVYCPPSDALPREQWDSTLDSVLAKSVSVQGFCSALQVEEEWFLEQLLGFSGRVCDQPEYRGLLEDIWEQRKEKQPFLAWDLLVRRKAKIALASALGRCEKSPEFRRYVVSNLDGPDPEVQSKAVGALMAVGDERDIERLTRFALSDDGAIAWLAVYSISAIGGEAGEAALQKAEKKYVSLGDERMLNAIKRARQGLNKMDYD